MKGFVADLEREPWRFDFHEALRVLERAFPDRPKIGDSSTRREDFLTLGQDPFLAFAPSALARADRDGQGRHRIVVRFMGLFGPQGALPLSVTEEALSWLNGGDDSFARFVDIIQNRFFQLFYRAWADARPVAQSDRPESDRFAAFVGAQIGIAGDPWRDGDALPDGSKLHFAGLLAAQSRSAARLAAFLEGLFGLPVEIDQFVGDRLVLDPADRSLLGRSACALGRSLLLGRAVFSVSERVTIRLYCRSLADYEALLPAGGETDRLNAAIGFCLGTEYLWTVEPVLPAAEVPALRIGDYSRLGWTSWMTKPAPAGAAARRDVRFDPSARRRPPAATRPAATSVPT